MRRRYGDLYTDQAKGLEIESSITSVWEPQRLMRNQSPTPLFQNPNVYKSQVRGTRIAAFLTRLDMGCGRQHCRISIQPDIHRVVIHLGVFTNA